MNTTEAHLYMMIAVLAYALERSTAFPPDKRILGRLRDEARERFRTRTDPTVAGLQAQLDWLEKAIAYRKRYHDAGLAQTARDDGGLPKGPGDLDPEEISPLDPPPADHQPFLT